MLRIERIDDLSTAKQVAVLLERECERLAERNAALASENARLRGIDPAQLQLLELEQLKLRIAQLERLTFGRSSERRADDAEAALEIPAAEAKPQKGHGPRKQPTLPLVEVVHELPEAERTCDACGHERAELPGQTETSEEITVVRRRFELVRHVRVKYLCSCEESPITTAPMPARLIVGGRYSTDFAVEVACDKYLNHLPLDRQRKMMHREGLEISTSTLWDQIEAVASVLRPAHDALARWILSKPLIHADETRWHLLVSPKSETWQAWGIACEDAVCYRILDSRSAEAGRSLLGGYEGVVMVDGYKGYEAIARGSPGMTLVNCWAHVRRKYVEIEHFYPAECKAILGMIRELYAIDAGLPTWAGLQGEDLARVLEAREAVRVEQSAPVIARILEWAGALRQTRESALRKAVEYMTQRWAGLTRFLANPRVPLDNNLIERSLRPIAMGRKNHLGSKSERGIEATAILYSMIESAKLAGVEPRAYLRAAVSAALEMPFRVLLPHEMRRS